MCACGVKARVCVKARESWTTDLDALCVQSLMAILVLAALFQFRITSGSLFEAYLFHRPCKRGKHPLRIHADEGSF